MMHDTPVIERHDRFLVVRDDLIPGGTKQVVLRAWLPELNQKHFVYVASMFGKGGAALAFACAELGFKCTLFMARAAQHLPWVDDVQKAGATIIWTDLIPVYAIEPMALEYAMQNDAYCLPLGFADLRFAELMAEYARKLPVTPQEIWCPVVSGTILAALERAFPAASVRGVSVVKHPDYEGKIPPFYAPEKYVRAAAVPPPYPSWVYSDAKVWRFAKKHGIDGAIIWNSNA